MTKKEPAKKATPKKTAKKKEQLNIVSDNTKLTLKLVWSDIETEYNRVLKISAKDVKSQGFRKGKAPLKVAEEKIGRERLVNKALETLIPPIYDKLIAAEKKQPLTQPQINPISMEWGKDWELEIQIAEKPVIKLDGYKKSVKKGLKAALKQLKEQEKSAAKDKKEDKDKEAKKATPEQTASKEREVKLHQIFKTLVEDVKPQIPELLLKDETKREIQRMAKELEKMGLSLDDYLARRGQKFEEMSSQIAAQVLGQLQLEFILREIEDKEKLEATEKEKSDELNKLEDKKMREQIKNNHHYLEHFSKQISRRKLIDQILEIK
jgi:FKBP-type peptidyl-prolyl cis-trans isomerase (trigger factor)